MYNKAKFKSITYNLLFCIIIFMIIKWVKEYSNLSIFVLTILFIFCINLSIYYWKYQELVYEEIYETRVEVLNIYEKENYYVLKLKNNDFTFFTNFEKIDEITQKDYINIAFLTKRIDFFDFLKGFYTKTIYYEKLFIEPTVSQTLINYSDSQHYNEMNKELFRALFFAVPISKELRDICANYGISHLMALSGFHLGILSFIIYWILYFPYSYFHTRYFPYRNIKYDVLIMVMFLLFLYVLLTDIVPSLFRAFVMMAFGLYLLRNNIKLFSFTNLFLVLLIIVALFPKYLFSLSLWFSIFGVFYIFLFIQYFKDIKSWFVQLLLFNFWIYFAMNPMVHYFFDTTSYEQLLSPIITLAFTIFYPLELFLHFIGYGGLFDKYLILFFSHKFNSFSVSTALWFFVIYMIVSFASIFDKRAFYVLNFLLLVFTIYLFFS